MFLFLIPLLLGFAFNSASAFTAAFSRRWGERRGRWIVFALRNVLGIPVWILGLGLALRAPVAPLFAGGPAAAAVAGFLIVCGASLVAWALGALGWRAAAPSVQDALVRCGPYARLRHPVYAGTLLQFAGLALWWPTPPALLACGLGAAWAVAQARLEEIDLLERLPAYREYMQTVPAFLPRRRK